MKRFFLPLLILLFFTGCTQSVELARKVTFSGMAKEGSAKQGTGLELEDPTVVTGKVEVYNRLGELLAISETDANGNFSVSVFNGIDFFIKITTTDESALGKNHVVAAYVDQISRDGRSGMLVNSYTTSIVYAIQNHLGVSLLGIPTDYAIIGYPGLLDIKNVATLIENHAQFQPFVEKVYLHVQESVTGVVLPEDIKRVMRTIHIDTTPPINRTALNFLANGDEITTSRNIIIDIRATDDVSLDAFFISENPDDPLPDTRGWIPVNVLDSFIGTAAMTLSAEDGTKTVYVWFKDEASNVSNSTSDTIILDAANAEEDEQDRGDSRPDVIETTPKSDAVDIAVNNIITLTFDTPMLDDTDLANFIIVPDTKGRLTWNNDNTILQFAPFEDLDYSEKYTITIGENIKSAQGVRMGTFYRTSFTTGQVIDNDPPVIIETFPENGEKQIGTKNNIYIRFNEEIDSSSVNNTTFILTGPDGDLPGVISHESKTIFFTPDTELDSSTEYTVSLTDSIVDKSGNAFSPYSFTFTSLDASISVVDMDAGANHTCVLFDSATVKCWGLNNSGQLGLSDLNFRGDEPDEMGANLSTVGEGVRIQDDISLSVSTGGFHTCINIKGGTLKCWGDNSKGQLGRGDFINTIGGLGVDIAFTVNFGDEKKLLDIATGVRHTCVLESDGRVKCWGWNGYGQLGSEESKDLGREPSDMGNPLKFIDFGKDFDLLKIFSGFNHNCALFNNGSLKCWGLNLDGQLGIDDIENRGNGAAHMGVSLPFIDLGSGRTVINVATGGNHSCVLLDNNSVKCWGWNAHGQLGVGDTDSRGDNAGEMGDNLPAVDLGADVTVLSITTGSNHSCALLNDGNVKCWGQNSYGQLGVGDTDSRGDNTDEMGDSLPAVNLGTDLKALLVTSGSNHSCALLNDGNVKCWGQNSYGQLGLGDTDNRGDNTDEMGDNLPQVSF